MSPVIKSAAVDISVRGLAVAPPPSVPSAEARLIAELEHRLEAAQADLAARGREIERLTAAGSTAFEQGHAEGLVEGRRSAEDRSEALVRAVAAAGDKGVAAFQETLAGLEEAVGGLTAVALDRIVGHAPDRQTLIAGAVHRAVGDLFAGSIVAVEVSREDFADPAPLRAVLPKDCDVHLLDGLSSGACRLRLRMGEVDLDLQGQAARLRAILDPARAPIR
jgi:type III secretion protein L